MPCRIKARTERLGNQIGRRARQTNVLCYRSILNVQAPIEIERYSGQYVDCFRSQTPCQRSRARALPQ